MNPDGLMERAIALGEKGRITAPPNPWVGCVIVKEGRIVGEGFHHKAGEPHAEVMALKDAGERAKEGAAFVTLEPCCHYGRTPPCIDALKAANISHVYVGALDPDSKVSGQGIAALKSSGIQVTTGVCLDAITKSLEPYLHHRKTKRPFCVVKAAISVDGRTAACDRSSKWITSEATRRDSHRIRAESQAIIIGSKTAIDDQPRLTVRDITPMPVKQPLKVVLDSSGRVEIASHYDLLFSCSPLKRNGCEVVTVSKGENGVNLNEVLEELGRRDVMQVMVEGGATLLGSFLQASLIDKLVLYIGPCALGDKGFPLFHGLDIPNIQEAKQLHLLDVARIEDCAKLTYQVKW